MVSRAESSDSFDPIEQFCLSIDGLKINDDSNNVFSMKGLSPIITSGESKTLLDALFRDLLKQTVNINVPYMKYFTYATFRKK